MCTSGNRVPSSHPSVYASGALATRGGTPVLPVHLHERQPSLHPTDPNADTACVREMYTLLKSTQGCVAVTKPPSGLQRPSTSCCTGMSQSEPITPFGFSFQSPPRIQRHWTCFLDGCGPSFLASSSCSESFSFPRIVACRGGRPVGNFQDAIVAPRKISRRFETSHP